jgi:hypothetical protein
MLKLKDTEWLKYTAVGGVIIVVIVLIFYILTVFKFNSVTYSKYAVDQLNDLKERVLPTWPAKLNKKDYNERLLTLTHYEAPLPIVATTTQSDGTIATTTEIISDLVYATSSTNVTVQGELWPASAPYPNGDAILPFKRILAYYGNFYSVRMGILGELASDEVLAKLIETKAEWEVADPGTPVLPAIQYIAMVAQASAGADGMYRAVMPDEEIEKAYGLAQEVDGILVLDLQVGKSTVKDELPQFRHFLSRPDVHLAIDPEFSMKYGDAPGTVIGTFDAEDINYIIDFLSDIVQTNKLPPKVLIVHRFTQNMLTNAEQIKPRPEVQVVIDMDGWGSKDLKRATYSRVIEPEPVQFTGVKIFYKNDLKPPSTGLFTPTEVLNLDPSPIYIQYQ